MRPLLVVALLLAGCTDFDLPSALSRPQILAVRATPAAFEPGGRAHLEALVAGPDGVLGELEPRWTTSTEGAAIEFDAEGEAWLAASRAGTIEVELSVAAGGEELAAVKSVTAGAAADNPEMVSLEAGGRPTTDPLVVTAGGAIALEAELDASGAAMSWFATVGEIELYRHNPTELVTSEPGEGWLIAVGRDGAGGVTWRTVRLVVE